MNWSKRRIAVYAILTALVLNLIVVSIALVLVVRQGMTGSVSSRQVEAIVDAHLKANPDVIRNVFVEMLKNPEAAQAEQGAPEEKTAEEIARLIGENRGRLFNSPHQVVLGNRKGDLSMVLFFDNNCGYCRRAHADMLGVIKANPQLRMVLKEYPILGPDSVEAAKIGIALRMQDPDGRKYAEFHERLMKGGHVDRAVALEAARGARADMKALERDLTSGEIDATLREGLDLGMKLGVTGTPSYVVGDRLIVGAVGEQELQKAITQASGK